MNSVNNPVNQDGRPTVFVVDDDASVREAVRSLLRSVGLSVETFGTAQEFLSNPRNSAPGCLVLDVRLPGIGGLELQHQLAERNLHVPIIFITGHGDIPMSVRAIKAGAVEVLTKPFRDQDLLDAVNQAIEQDRRAREQRAEIAELRRRYEGLSRREQEVMGLVVRGFPNKQIAGTLGTSEATIKLHRARSIQKMQAGSLADLIRMAEKLGIPAHL
jgi:FixJ family two-component response regulator